MAAGRRFDIHPTGMLALDVARVEAGLLLIDVDFHGSKKALTEAQTYSPFEMSLDRLVKLDKRPFVGREALAEDHRRGPVRRIVGLEIDWQTVERLYEELAMPPQIAASASRTSVPVYRHGRQVGKATTTTWSPVLKRFIGLATIDGPYFAEDTPLEIEVTVEAVRHHVPARVVKTPFYNPPRKTSLPAL
jgi:aminomethyltransferase